MTNPRKTLFFGVPAASLTINALQGRRIKQLQDLAESTSTSGELRPGTLLPKLNLRDSTGRDFVVDFGSARIPTVLYVLRPSCVWCERNAGSLSTLASQAGGRYRFLGISLSSDGLPQFVQSRKITFPVYTVVDDASIAGYRLGVTPETFVVSPESRLIKVWLGAYSSAVGPSVESFFSIKLAPQI